MSSTIFKQDVVEEAAKRLPEVTVNVAIPPEHLYRVQSGPSARTRSWVQSQSKQANVPETDDEVGINTNLPERQDSDDETIIMADDAESEAGISMDSLNAQQKKGRGRPPSISENVSVRERKAREREMKEIASLKQAIIDLDEPTPPKKKAWAKCQKMTKDIVEELRNAPTNDVCAGLLEDTIKVFKVGNTSGHLNGGFVNTLYSATARIRAAAIILGERGSSSPSSEDIAAMKSRIEDLTRQVQVLEEDRKNRDQRPISVDPVERIEGMEIDPMPSTQEGRAPPQHPLTPAGYKGSFDFSTQEQPTILRPALRGKQVELEITLPRGLKKELVGAYKNVSSQILALTTLREKLVEGKTDALPDLSPSPQLPPIVSQAEFAEPSAPVRSGGGEEKGKKARKRVATQAPPPAVLPASKGEPKKTKGKKSTPPTLSSRAGPAAIKKTATEPPTTELPEPAQAQSWSKVVGRKKKRKEVKAATERAANPKAVAPPKIAKSAAGKVASPKVTTPPKAAKPTSGGRKRRRAPRTAAVSLTCPEGEYADAMRLVKASINLGDLGIGVPHMRKGITGALILEIPGEESAAKADALAARMTSVLAGREGVKIARPQKKADLRLTDVDDTTSETEIAAIIAAETGCIVEDVKVGEIKQSLNRMGTVWVQCPVAAANKLAAASKIRVGWTMARVQLLEARALQCFKCLEKGHTQSTCPGGPDRTGCCFRCGEKGHIARGCTAPIRCPVCADLGRKADHRVGSKACTPPKRRPAPKSVSKPAPSAAAATTVAVVAEKGAGLSKKRMAASDDDDAVASTSGATSSGPARKKAARGTQQQPPALEVERPEEPLTTPNNG